MKKQTKKELMNYFTLTFAFSWIFWLPGVLTYFNLIACPTGLLKLFEVIGAIGPAVITFILIGRLSGKKGVKKIIKSAFNIPTKWQFWLLASLLLLSLHAASRLIYQLVSPQVPAPSITSPVEIVFLFILYFFLGGGLGEEIGWRGFALDRLQEKYSALNASLLLAAIWIVWHLPLFFYGGTNQSLIPFWLFILTVIPLGIMLTWVYNNTKTIFAAAMFHTIGNIAHDIFIVFPTTDTPSITGFTILTLVYYLAAIIILAVFGKKTLIKNK